MSRTSSPRLLDSSGTRALSGQKAGRPMTHSDPSTGPATEPTPPMTAMASTCRESWTVNTSLTVMVESRPPSSAPPKPARPPATANAWSFTRAGRDGVRRGGVGVVAHGDHGPPDPGSAEPGHQHHDDREGHQRHVVVGALVGQVDRAEQGPLDEHRSAAAAGQERTGKDVLRHGQGEHKGHHRQQQAPHPQRTGPEGDRHHRADGGHRPTSPRPVTASGKSITMRCVP